MSDFHVHKHGETKEDVSTVPGTVQECPICTPPVEHKKPVQKSKEQD